MPDGKARGIGKLILFGIIFLLLLTAASAACRPVDWYDDNCVQNRNARITEMKKQDPQTVEILNMGDSLSLATLTPMEMWRQKGYTSFNIGADGIRMPEAYYTVVEASENQTPKYLMLETLMLFRYNEKQDMQMLISQPLYHRFTFLKYHSIWKPYVEGRGVKIYHKGYLVNRKVNPYEGSLDYLDEPLGSGNKTAVPDFNRAWFRRIKKFCDQNQITLILYSMASPKNYDWERINNLEKFAQEEGVEYLDLNQMWKEIGIDWMTDSNDHGDHLNLSGVEKVTTFFGNYFSEKGGLTDHRGDPAFSSWDEELIAYDKLVEEMEGRSFADVQNDAEKARKQK